MTELSQAPHETGVTPPGPGRGRSSPRPGLPGPGRAGPGPGQPRKPPAAAGAAVTGLAAAGPATLTAAYERCRR